jgi:hypothetical protein
MIYNNDVGHCMGIDCSSKDDCYRHWLYLEMHKHEGGAWVMPNCMWNNKECEDFIKRY